MSRKNNLPKFQNIVNGNMTGTITSSVSDIQWIDNVAVQLNFTGSPVGVVSVEVSSDYQQDYLQNVTSPGNWIVIASANTSAGSPILFDLNQLASPFIRVVYTPTSGSGTLQGFITGKMI